MGGVGDNKNTDVHAVGKVRPRFLSCVLNIHRRHPGNSQMLCKLAATHAPPRVEVRLDRLQPKKPPSKDSTPHVVATAHDVESHGDADTEVYRQAGAVGR